MSGLMGNPYGFRGRQPQGDPAGEYIQQRAMPSERRALQGQGLSAASSVSVPEYWRDQNGVRQMSDSQTAMERYGDITLNEIRRLVSSGSREERVIAEDILRSLTLNAAYPSNSPSLVDARNFNAQLGELRKVQQAPNQGRPLPRRGRPTY